MFQNFQLLARTPAVGNVGLPLVYRGLGRGERRRLATEALESVGLGHRLQHRPSQLSGGEQQRVAIARALVTEPAMLLADEPTGNLDSRSGEEVLELLARLHADRGVAVVVVTHDPGVAAGSAAGSPCATAAWRARRAGPVRLGEAVRVAWEALRANKLRSGLTMLGVVIGVASVVLLVSIGSGARDEVTSGSSRSAPTSCSWPPATCRSARPRACPGWGWRTCAGSATPSATRAGSRPPSPRARSPGSGPGGPPSTSRDDRDHPAGVRPQRGPGRVLQRRRRRDPPPGGRARRRPGREPVPRPRPGGQVDHRRRVASGSSA